jgi:hypothetical protein
MRYHENQLGGKLESRYFTGYVTTTFPVDVTARIQFLVQRNSILSWSLPPPLHPSCFLLGMNLID